MKRLTYLAAPYSVTAARPAGLSNEAWTDYCKWLRAARTQLINQAAAALMRKGELIFSPISHSHAIAEDCDLPTNFEFWREFDHAMLEVCGKLIVLKLEGWCESLGVNAEIDMAHSLKLPIVYMTWEEAVADKRSFAMPESFTITDGTYSATVREVAAEIIDNTCHYSIDMILPCPKCGVRHVDAPEPENGWTNPPHKSHLCAACGCVWRPADVWTNGVTAIKTRGEKDTWPKLSSMPDSSNPQ